MTEERLPTPRQDGRREFEDQVVVVTGASAGVGRATVRAFAKKGAKVGLLARGPERLEAARREVEWLGGEAVAVPTDVAHPEQVEAAAARIEEALGPVDVWVNNAMATIFAPFTEITAEEYRRATEVTYLGTVHGTMAALRRMVPRDRGTVVQVGSALAYRAIPLQAPYCGAKHAVRGFTDSVRSELIHEGSRVHLTMVQLPAVNTPQFRWGRSKMDRRPQPVPPIYEPEVAARGIVWAAAHRRREVAVGAPSVKTIVGQKVAPGYLDHYLADAAWEGQMTDEPDDPDRPDNLFQPAPGDWAAHGTFDERARDLSPQLWANTHRAWVAAGLVAAGVGVVAALLRRT